MFLKLNTKSLISLILSDLLWNQLFAIYVTGYQCHSEKRDNIIASKDENGNSDWKSCDNIYKKP